VFGHPQFFFGLVYLIRGFINSDNYHLFQKALGLLFRGTLPSASEWTWSTIHRRVRTQLAKAQTRGIRRLCILVFLARLTRHRRSGSDEQNCESGCASKEGSSEIGGSQGIINITSPRESERRQRTLQTTRDPMNGSRLKCSRRKALTGMPGSRWWTTFLGKR
jgi:hypothetical protein